MSQHSYTRCWLHLIWATLHHQKLLSPEACKRLYRYFSEYAPTKEIYLKSHYVNPDHVHILLDLPTKYTMEDVAQFFKGSSSHWINQNDLVQGKFSWQTGYAAFSVSQSQLEKVAQYIKEQEEHHRIKTFSEEYEAFIKRYGLSLSTGEVNR